MLGFVDELILGVTQMLAMQRRYRYQSRTNISYREL